MRNLITRFSLWLSPLFILVGLTAPLAQADSFHSPILFRMAEAIKKNDPRVRTEALSCPTLLKTCDENFVRSQHPQWKGEDNWGFFTTKLFEHLERSRFPNDFAQIMREKNLPESMIQMFSQTPNLEAAYFEGQVFSDDDAMDLNTPTWINAFSVRDPSVNEVLYIVVGYQ
jgi:hypothetical protein